MPIWARGYNVHDDYLMVQNAMYLLKGEWLGPYSHMTLIKGIGYPMFLVAAFIMHIPILMAQIIFHAFACVLFIYILSVVIKNKWVLGSIFTFLLFDPGVLSIETFLMIYRNNISAANALYFLSFYIGIYIFLFDDVKKRNLFCVGAGIALAFLWNTREDALWVIPFVVFISILICFKTFLRNESLKIAFICILLPLSILFICNSTIGVLNYFHYGVFTRLEINSGSFSKMLKIINSIEPDEQITRVSVPKKQIDKLYAISPAFSELKPYLEEGGLFLGWDKLDGVEDGQVHDACFMWMMRDAIIQNYKNAAAVEKYCNRVYRDIGSH